MQLIDTHAHLFISHFQKDVEQVIERAKKTGIIKIFNPNIDLTTIEAMLELEAKYPDYCLPMIGLHPVYHGENIEKEIYEIENWLTRHKFFAIGEIGLDFYKGKDDKESQIQLFTHQVRLAKKFGLPIVIHIRKAFNEVFEVLNKENDENLKGIFHCFTGNIQQAEKIISYGGFKLGIGGVVTFKNSKLPKTLQHIDIQHIVLETDSPFLTPEPHRGKRNEPAYVKHVADKIAEIKNLSVEQVAEITTQNALEVFGGV